MCHLNQAAIDALCAGIEQCNVLSALVIKYNEEEVSLASRVKLLKSIIRSPCPVQTIVLNEDEGFDVKRVYARRRIWVR